MFDGDKCQGDFAECGGMCSTWDGEDGFSIIGIERGYLAADEDELARILLHEFAHGFTQAGKEPHSPSYHAKLAQMIMFYNTVYGTDVQDEFYDFNGEGPRKNYE